MRFPYALWFLSRLQLQLQRQKSIVHVDVDNAVAIVEAIC